MKHPVYILLMVGVLCACNTLKYVPENKQLLSQTQLHIRDAGTVTPNELKTYMRQQPNVRFWGIFGLNLGLYNLSGPDTSKWINRTLRAMGDPPVIYDPLQTERSVRAMERYLFSRGYFNADVKAYAEEYKKQRIRSSYEVTLGQPYRIRSYEYVSENEDIRLDSLLQSASMQSGFQRPQAFNSDELNKERTRMAQLARNHGYYAINRDHFSYEVDSALNSHQVDVRLKVKPFSQLTTGNDVRVESHRQYYINKVYFLLDVPTNSFVRNEHRYATDDYDTLQIEGYQVVYRLKPFLSPRSLLQNCFIRPGDLYAAAAVEKTYARLNAFQNMKYVNIRFVEQSTNEQPMLDCYIVLTPNEKHIISIDAEGTNTSGDLGIAGTVSYSHLNLFGSGEVLSLSLRGGYEFLSSFKNNYFEYGGEMAFHLPTCWFPFLSSDFRRNIDAKTQFALSLDILSRPEFERRTAAFTTLYTWRNKNMRHALTPIDLAYVFMPRVDSTFQATYLRDDSYLKYSYENQFILSSSYGFTYSSLPQGLDHSKRVYYTWRANVETAGLLLYMAYRQFGTPNKDGQYAFGNNPFSQYIKADVEYSRNLPLNTRNRLAYRASLGVAYPYGNSRILPFEKRFYSGGANSVRGWSMRTLGPGTYKTHLNSIDFMNQSGDMKIDLSVEWRHDWFWKLELASFLDAGNIWTLRAYDSQPGGQFRFNSFYQELACSAGVGLRLNFDFLLIRLDGGVKLYDPSGATPHDKWRIKHLSLSSMDDYALHIAIGYPF